MDEDRERLVSFDASRRGRDERLNRVMDQFNTKPKDKYSDRNKLVTRGSGQKHQQQYDDDDDDEDDIVAMMDKMN